jgi:hypothetical protein
METAMVSPVWTLLGGLWSGALMGDAVYAAAAKAPSVAGKPLTTVAGAGALPKGDVKKVDAQKVSGPTQSAAVRASCALGMQEPPGGTFVFSADGSTLYMLLDRVKAKVVAKGLDDGGASGEAGGKHKGAGKKLTLYKISLATPKAEAVLAVDYHPHTSLVTYGTDEAPLIGLSTVTFTGPTAECNDGPANVVTVSFGNKAQKAVRTTATLQIVEGPNGRSLADTKKAAILEMDTETFQTRGARALPKGERPLYFDRESDTLVSWRDAGKHRGLVRHQGEDVSKLRRLALKPGDRYLQDGEYFAVVHVDVKTNTVEVTEVPEWSSMPKLGKYQVKLPRAYPLDTGAFTLRFARRLVLFSGADFLAQQRWQNVLLYDYSAPEPLVVFKPTSTFKQYVQATGLDPTGGYAVVEVHDLATHALLSLKIFNVMTGKTADLVLP